MFEVAICDLKKSNPVISVKTDVLSSIESRILNARGEKVILDSDLAAIYGVSPKRLNETVRRNLDRFPSDFCFQLTEVEWDSLKSQIATSNQKGRGGRRSRPLVFTEHGAIMAANILRSDEAVQLSIFVVRAFIKMRQILQDTGSLAAKLTKLEKEITVRLDSHEKGIVELMQQFFNILNPPGSESSESEKREIGFHVKGRHEATVTKLKRER